MTGIERLRILAGAWDEWGLGGTLAEIADQIDRELREERDRWDSELCEAQMDKSRVTAVYLEMNKHVLGHEGADDSPVARWARELREAIGGGEADEDREAAAWVRDRGGLDYVRAEWRSRVPRDRYERRRQSLLGHIAECETALGRRREIISDLGHRVSDLTLENAELRRRVMPEGMEWLVEAWPRFEGDAPVKLGDMALIDGDVDMVEAVQLWIHGKPVVYGDGGSQQLERGERVRRPAVLAVDGVPIETCQKMWRVRNGEEVRVSQIDRGEHPIITYIGEDGLTHEITPDGLTHTKPEPLDSIERIADEIDRLREDVAMHLGDYLYDEDGNDSIQFSMELVAKRCRALAEREMGECAWGERSD